MSKFQIIILGIFALFAAGGLVFFAVYKGNNKNATPLVTIWGTLDQNTVSTYLEALTKQSGTKMIFKYTQYPSNQFYQSYVEALATANGPDLIIMSQDQYLEFYNKIFLIPYSSFSQSTFKTTYLQGDTIYLQSQGIAAIPFMVDPLVMYWNKDIFRNALVATPPTYWGDFTTLAPKLTVKDASLNITTSAVGLGEYQNIDHAKELLSLLMMQTGNPITVYTTLGLSSALESSSSNSDQPPTVDALNFYTQFANPLKDTYTWNRSLPDSQTLFIQNHLGVYFGFASERQTLINRNPNLNFDVAVVPQSKATSGGQPIKVTYSRLYGLAISRGTTDSADALLAAELMGSQLGSTLWSQYTGLPSDRRDSLNFSSSNAVTATFAQSAFLSQAWLDPNPSQTNTIFQMMVENVTSGRTSVAEALSQANTQLQNLLQPPQ